MKKGGIEVIWREDVEAGRTGKILGGDGEEEHK